MAFITTTNLLDSLVLAIVENEDTYGYKITQEIRSGIEVSESTLYPVLRRLLKDNCLESYDKAYMGRNRRYYKITDKGKLSLDMYRDNWQQYKKSIEKILLK